MAAAIQTEKIQVLLPEGVKLTSGPTDNGDGTFNIGVTPSTDIFDEKITVIYKGDAQTIPFSTKPINISKVEVTESGNLVGAGMKKKFKLTYDADIRLENVVWTSEDNWKLVKGPEAVHGNAKQCEITLEAPKDFSKLITSTISFGYKGSDKTSEKTYKVEEFDNLFQTTEFKPATIKNGETSVCVLTFKNYVSEDDYPTLIRPSAGLTFVSREFDKNTIKIKYKATQTGSQSVTLTCYEGKAMETSRRADLTVN